MRCRCLLEVSSAAWEISDWGVRILYMLGREAYRSTTVELKHDAFYSQTREATDIGKYPTTYALGMFSDECILLAVSNIL